MKQVTIIYHNKDNPNAIAFIKSNLEETFGQYITFSNYYIEDLAPDTTLKADAFLAAGEKIFQEIKEYVDDFRKIIKLNRSPDKNSLTQISKIPAGRPRAAAPRRGKRRRRSRRLRGR